jgi:uncharacterized protein YggU (UPF0235/DUF167 family)
MQPQWISVKVHPGAGKEALISLGPGRFEAWVRAKPVTGQATEAVVALLAQGLRMAARDIQLIKGHTARHKVFKILAPRA